MKRILLIADVDALWTQRYVEYLLMPEKMEIVIFPIWGNGKKFDAFYKEHGITVYNDYHTLPIIRYVPRLRMWVRIALNARDLEKLGPFDIVHNHYLSQRDLSLGLRLKRKYHAKWVCSFWGSDLMRSPKLELKRMKRYLEQCDAVTVHSELNREQIRRVYGTEIAKKTTLLYFGQMGYSAIDRMRAKEDEAACRAYFGIAPDRFVICVGYSAATAQQLLPVVEALSLLKPELLGKITIVLQQTYSEDDPAYSQRVREAAGRLPCQTVALTKFMNSEESARLRISADLFILAIKTDAFSASMQEYLYAGAAVVKGDWLGYPQLTDMGITLTDFHDFAELPWLVEQAMDGRITGLSQEQRLLFPQLYSWQAVRESWLVLYR